MAALIKGVSHFVPEHVVTNNMLAELMDTSDEWIRQRTGIQERRWMRGGSSQAAGPANAWMAQQAGRAALDMAKVRPEDIDAIVYATISPDNEYPGSGALLAESLMPGLGRPVLEVRNHCTGFLYALSAAHAYITTGIYKNVLVLGGELQSTGLNVCTAGREMSVLFGDGFGALVLGPSPREEGILGVRLESDGTHYRALGVSSPGFQAAVPYCAADFEQEKPRVFPHMDGKLVFKLASQRMPEIIRKVVAESDYTLEDIALVVPHQANQRILDMVEQKLGLHGRVYSNIARYGNTTAGTIPIALSEAYQAGRIKPADLVCLVSFGAGFSWGAVLVRWSL